MIKINLLPREEIKAVPDIKREVSIVFLFYILLILVGAYLFININGKISTLKKELQSAQIELAKYKDIQKKLTDLKKQKEIIEQKIKVVSVLEKERKKAIEVLNALTANFLVNKMWFEELTLEGNQLSVKGIALGNETVAEFMERLKKIPYFQVVELIKTEKKKIAELNLTKFTLKCNIRIIGEKV
ncbi:MAG: Fimbrial assembly protein (PilN) [Candidatus Methanoperedenaceae archaeon GB50]|nr:Fimbrial assembly protein (PilN) [Candidatus Methanoperedenaceae archaeon GB50]CAD7773384.1 Fimbrial assembly protein (PilN) [Candidatus Methanoperedenaceae archaeon GB37]CAD7777443.1 MAG: Fimbrial assembly protein (PilN) [Candidatus Methanoperedenaceae archaeon GB50]